jgi:predicted RNase H-like HicB family nuclease
VLAMNLTIETEQEDDGRWIAEVPELAGVLVYGSTREEAMAKAQALALRVLAEQLEQFGTMDARDTRNECECRQARA